MNEINYFQERSNFDSNGKSFLPAENAIEALKNCQIILSTLGGSAKYDFYNI